MTNRTYIPWVEKYRPTNFDGIVLDKFNKIILNNIIQSNYMPNLLLYGPPGTGKTTTIINLINYYQKKNDQNNKGLMIHLNASDERGIDIIRNQINTFVNSQTLFVKGIKFVILDEVDYMTKNAQLALKYLLQEYRENVRFCLICNYISKIDDSLQNEFVKLRFTQLPGEDIIKFLNIININENLNLPFTQLESIQKNYKSDIRSMINYIQSNQLELQTLKVIDKEIFEQISNTIKHNSSKEYYKLMVNLSLKYNIDLRNLLKIYLNYIIKYNNKIINTNILNHIEFLIHNPDANLEDQLKYLFYLFKDISEKL